MKPILFLLKVSLFFPFVGVISGIDVQPNFFLLSLIVLLLNINRLKIPKNVLLITILTLFILSFRYVLELEYLTSNYVLEGVISLFTPILIYLLLRNKLLVINNKFIIFVVAIYVLVGVIQLFVPDFLVSLVSRDAEAINMLLDTGRGVRSLTGEPSQFGKNLVILNILLVYRLYLKGERRNKLIYITLFIFFINVLVPQSAYSVSIHFIILTLLVFVLGKVKYLVLVSITTLILTVNYDLFVSGSSRIVRMFTYLVESPEMLMNQGSFRRLMNIPISILSSIEYGLFGIGNAPFRISSELPFINYPFYTSNKFYGGAVEFFLKLGILSIPIYVIYLSLYNRISKVKIYNIKMGFFLMLSIFLIHFQDGSLANPLTWFLLIYIYSNQQKLNYVRYNRLYF